MFDGQKGAKQSLNVKTGYGRRQHQDVKLRANKRDAAISEKRLRTQTGGGSSFLSMSLDPWYYTKDSPAATIPLALLPEFVKLAKSDVFTDVFQGVVMIRKLLAVEEKAPIQEVVETGITPRLVECMTQEDQTLQFEASWALSNIASGAPEHTQHIISHNVCPHWVVHLSSSSPDCVEQAAWALGNISGEGHRCRDYLLESCHTLQPLLAAIVKPEHQTILSLMQNATWALSNLCRFKPAPSFHLVSPAVSVLCNLVVSNDISIALDAAWAISYVSEGSAERVDALLDTQILPTLINLLQGDNIKFYMPAIRTIGNVCGGVDRQTQVVINLGGLRAMKHLLSPQRSRAIRKETLWTISNIAAGNIEQIQALINEGILSLAIECLQNAEHEVMKEACWAVANLATNGTPDQILYIVQIGVIPRLCGMLRESLDVKVLTVAIEALGSILEAGDFLREREKSLENPFVDIIKSSNGDEYLSELQVHSFDAIRSLSTNILKSYFDIEDDLYEADTNMTNNITDIGGGFDVTGGNFGTTDISF
eukprot:Tbor_TRINITY_DN5883_c1_g4::TRINITY_DN5883_c1_g4_i1::g.6505::m.6505